VKSVALLICASCSVTATGSLTVATPKPTPIAGVKPDDSACRAAYAEYEVEWRAARNDELKDAMAGYEELIEETIRTELLTTPSRAEIRDMREIYAIIDAFLWDAPWPRALKAAEAAIESCGEGALRPS
jgi:hypothetical protein